MIIRIAADFAPANAENSFKNGHIHVFISKHFYFVKHLVVTTKLIYSAVLVKSTE